MDGTVVADSSKAPTMFDAKDEASRPSRAGLCLPEPWRMRMEREGRRKKSLFSALSVEVHQHSIRNR